MTERNQKRFEEENFSLVNGAYLRRTYLLSPSKEEYYLEGYEEGEEIFLRDTGLLLASAKEGLSPKLLNKTISATAEMCEVDVKVVDEKLTMKADYYDLHWDIDKFLRFLITLEGNLDFIKNSQNEEN